MVYMLWGKPAQTKMKMLNNPKHLILTAPHPSPLSAYAAESFAAEAEKVACILRSHTALHPEFSSQIADVVRRGIDAEMAYWDKSLKG